MKGICLCMALRCTMCCCGVFQSSYNPQSEIFSTINCGFKVCCLSLVDVYLDAFKSEPSELSSRSHRSVHMDVLSLSVSVIFVLSLNLFVEFDLEDLGSFCKMHHLLFFVGFWELFLYIPNNLSVVQF